MSDREGAREPSGEQEPDANRTPEVAFTPSRPVHHEGTPNDPVCDRILTCLRVLLRTRTRKDPWVNIAELHRAMGGYEAGFVALHVAIHVDHLAHDRLVVYEEPAEATASRYATSRALDRRITLPALLA